MSADVIHVVNKDLENHGFLASNRAFFSTFRPKSALKVDPSGKFQAARPSTFRGLERRDGAEPGRVDLHVRRLVVPMVEDISRFKSELEFALLRK